MEDIAHKAPQLQYIREKVAAGQYDLSEHLLRMLTTGRITMDELEKSVREGQITAYRRNRQERLASIIRGECETRIIRSLWTETGDDRLCLLLAYLQPRPEWQQDLGIRQVGGNTMSELTRQCFFCGGDVVPIIVGNFDYRLNGQLYVVKNVPAGLCQECGEKYITRQAARTINGAIDRGRYESVDQVQVLLFPQEEEIKV